MPLVRLQVRNEYGLGQPELYKETNREDPKAVLDGVAVAGLVGILRQLGDLADFAAEVFHGLQEQAMITANRSHKLMVRVQNIESSLPPLEKAVLAQTSHIHFAYAAGCEWHPRMKTKRNHFIYSDLPQFVMDSYEECRDPPRLHLLDKFDAGGPGSCLMRYSDPTFFKRVSAYSDEAYSEKFERARKSRKSKKKRLLRRKEVLRGEEMHNISGRMHFISPVVNRRTSSLQTASTVDVSIKSDPEDQSNSFDSRAGADYIECVFHPGNSMQPDDQDYKQSSSRSKEKANNVHSVSPLMDDNIAIDSLEKQNASSSSGVTWEEKEEIVEPMSQAYDKDKKTEMLAQKQDPNMHDGKGATLTKNDYSNILFDEESNLKPVACGVQADEIDSEPDNYMDALNTIELESENDLDCDTKQAVDKINSHVTDGIMENGIGVADSTALDHNLYAVVSRLSSVSFNNETGREFPDSLQVNPPLISDMCASKSEAPVNKEMSRDLADCQVSENPICEQVPSISSVSSNKEADGDFPYSLQVNPPVISDLYGSKSDTPVNREMSRDLAESQVSEGPIHEEVPVICENSDFACLVSTDSLGSAHALKDNMSASIESDIAFSGSKSSGLPDEEADRINSNIFDCKENPMESSSDHSVRFWTNGGLLGLEPSKPPNFSMSSPLRRVSLTAKTEIDGGGQCHNSKLKSNGCKGEQDLLAEIANEIEKEPSSRCLTLSCEDQASISEKTSDIHKVSNEISPTGGNNLDETRVLTAGRVLPAAPDSKATSTELNRGSGENSSRVFGLGQMLLMNSFHRKVSFDEKSVPDSSLKSGRLEQSGQNSIIDQSLPETTFKKQVDYGYPFDSLPPSPPLEHMKISFHSISGRETSKLKLKFPEGTNRHESMRDVFPSFQLVPEPSNPLHDSGFNSDDNDTFCRSSPYVSDDCPSPHSDYNSDEWESGESPESSVHGVDDFSPDILSSESLNSQEFTGVSNNDINVASGTYSQNGVEPSLSGPILGFPSFDSVNPLLPGESCQDSNVNNIVKSQGHAETTPPPPPPPPCLPPVQWRVSKLQLDMINDSENYISEEAEKTKGLNLSESTFSPQPRPAQMEQKLTNHDDHKSDGTISQKMTYHKSVVQIDQKNLNGKKEANQEVMGKELAEKEDFLQQIRTKSFNLRPTVTGKPNANTSPTTNDKVTAILEKANAIRQVVASDDGEDDDNWSDT